MFLNKKIHFEVSERKVLLRIFDVLIILLGLFLTDTFFEFKYFTFSSSKIGWILVLAIYINLIGTIFEMYHLQVASEQYQIVKSIILTSSVTVLLYLLTPFFTPILPMNRIQIVMFFISIFFSLLLWRLFYANFLASHRFEKRAILICENDDYESLVSGISNIDPHYVIKGYISTSNQNNSLLENEIRIATLSNFVIINQISEIVIASKNKSSLPLNLHNQLLKTIGLGISIKDYSTTYEIITQRLLLDYFEKDFNIFFSFSRNNQNKLYLIVSRLFDILVSIIGLIIGLMILPLIIIGNMIANRGNLIYYQERVGKNGRTFKIYKFRTMVKNAEKSGAVFATKYDNRVTKFGKILRKTRLDEIPQFINVLIGDMAFIGPRPERPFFVESLQKEISFYDTRHIVKPGLTGWAQVNYNYGSTIEDSFVKLQYDLFYIKHRSIFMDINIIIKTLSTVLFYRGQ